MLLDAFVATLDRLPPERYRTIAASTAGNCGRKLAMGLYPERFVPERMTARRRARLMAGKEYERIILRIVERELFAETAGETAFLWPIELDNATMREALDKTLAGRLNAHIVHDMNPHDIARWRAECLSKGMTRLGGVILDPQRNRILLPALSDGLANLAKRPEFARQKYAMATVDFKTMSTAGFRNILRGALDYGYRTQFAIQAEAAELDTHVGLYYRLETSHAIEVIYSKLADRTRTTFTMSNGATRTTEELTEPKTEWEQATIETPFQSHILQQARERIRAVLRSSPDALPIREYGPSFTCKKCAGTGARRHRCGYCNDEGYVKRSLKSKSGPKVCKRCERGKVACPGCKGRGFADAAVLPWNCTYCPFVASCWVDHNGAPLYRIVIEPRFGGRPASVIDKLAFEASGITFQHPEKPA